MLVVFVVKIIQELYRVVIQLDVLVVIGMLAVFAELVIVVSFSFVIQ